MLDPPVGGEVEDGLLAEGAGVEVAIGGDELVLQRAALGDDLAGRRDNHRAAHQVVAILVARLGDADHPGASSGRHRTAW